MRTRGYTCAPAGKGWVGHRPSAALFAIVLLALIAPVRLQAQAPRIRTELDPALVSVGDRMRFSVRVEHDPTAVVVWPDSLNLGSVEVLDAEILSPVSEGGRTVTSARFTLVAFELGDLEIPSVDVLVEAPDGSAITVATDPYVVTVQSVGLDEGGDIRAIRGPLGLPFNVIYMLPWVVLLMVLAGLGYWIWTRRKPVVASPRRSVDIPRFPHEDAYEALDRLEASGLVDRGEIKEFHILASEIVRTYVEGRFGVYALELTTAEVVGALRSEGLEQEAVRIFAGFADRCDLVKFAKLRPGSEACGDLLEAARAFVDQTQPRIDPFDGRADNAADARGGETTDTLAGVARDTEDEETPGSELTPAHGEGA
jgi:hypothetical protein